MIDLPEHFPCIGVTGTNGKTTVSYLLAQILPQTGLIGTLGAGFVEDLVITGYTTPPLEKTDELVVALCQKGAKAIVMEASSHGLQQGRMKNIPFNTAIFTNLTQDHLDYHGDMVNYAQAKATLFKWPSLDVAIVNKDDPSYGLMLQDAKAQTWTYACHDKKSDVALLAAHPKPDGFELSIQTPLGSLSVKMPLLGSFNISNYLAVVSAAIVNGLSLSEIQKKTKAIRAPKGRMERFESDQHADIIIDYAHTADALDKAINACQTHCSGKLWVVFGCGGDRDRGKRPLMAKAAEKADVVIVTEDNPRHEDPAQIMGDICQGFECDTYRIVKKRDDAITSALIQADKNDMVLLAGKGHETYMDVQGVKHHFDEREVLHAFSLSF